MPYALLSQLAKQPLPQEISDPDHIDMVRILCNEGLVEADIPICSGFELLHAYQGSARVNAITATGQRVTVGSRLQNCSGHYAPARSLRTKPSAGQRIRTGSDLQLALA